MSVLVFVSDLLFRSKIDGAARGAGSTVIYARAGEDPGKLTEMHAPELVLVDLSARTHDPGATITAARAAAPGARIVAFGSHVDEAALAKARRAGADQAMPRSTFSRQVGEILSDGSGS